MNELLLASSGNEAPDSYVAMGFSDSSIEVATIGGDLVCRMMGDGWDVVGLVVIGGRLFSLHKSGRLFVFSRLFDVLEFIDLGGDARFIKRIKRGDSEHIVVGSGNKLIIVNAGEFKVVDTFVPTGFETGSYVDPERMIVNDVVYDVENDVFFVSMSDYNNDIVYVFFIEFDGLRPINATRVSNDPSRRFVGIVLGGGRTCVVGMEDDNRYYLMALSNASGSRYGFNEVYYFNHSGAGTRGIYPVYGSMDYYLRITDDSIVEQRGINSNVYKYRRTGISSAVTRNRSSMTNNMKYIVIGATYGDPSCHVDVIVSEKNTPLFPGFKFPYSGNKFLRSIVYNPGGNDDY